MGRLIVHLTPKLFICLRHPVRWTGFVSILVWTRFQIWSIGIFHPVVHKIHCKWESSSFICWNLCLPKTESELKLVSDLRSWLVTFFLNIRSAIIVEHPPEYLISPESYTHTLKLKYMPVLKKLPFNSNGYPEKPERKDMKNHWNLCRSLTSDTEVKVGRAAKGGREENVDSCIPHWCH